MTTGEGRNLLVIMMDELSRDGVGCYGGVGLTPSIDKLASTGTRFENAYTPSPNAAILNIRSCPDSRRSLATHRLPR